MAISKPNTFVASTVISSTEMNENFDTLFETTGLGLKNYDREHATDGTHGDVNVTSLVNTGTSSFTGSATFKADIKADADGTLDIGASATRFANVWTDSLNGSTPFSNSVFSTAGNYTITDSDGYTHIIVTATATITLPTLSANADRLITIKNTGSGIVTIDGEGSETIDGNTTVKLYAENQAMTIIGGSSDWHITEEKPSDWVSYTPTFEEDNSNASATLYIYKVEGDTCHITGRISWGGVGGAGDFSTSLPIAESTTYTGDHFVGMCHWWNDSLSDHSRLRMVLIDGSQKVEFYYDTTLASGYDGDNFGANDYITFSGFYKIDRN